MSDPKEGDLRFVERDEVFQVLDDGKMLCRPVRILQVYKEEYDEYAHDSHLMWVDVPCVKE